SGARRAHSPPSSPARRRPGDPPTCRVVQDVRERRAQPRRAPEEGSADRRGGRAAERYPREPLISSGRRLLTSPFHPALIKLASRASSHSPEGDFRNTVRTWPARSVRAPVSVEVMTTEM